MAYVTPTSRAAGYVVPETVWNQDVVDNVIALRTGAIAQASQSAGDVVIAATSTQLGRVASPSDATQFLNGAATPAFAQVKDSDLSTSDVTTNNASTSKHGFLKKLSNVATEFMNGEGNWTAVAISPITKIAGGSGTSSTDGAQNLALASISGLTNVDRLLVKVSFYKSGASGPSIELYNSTDSVGMSTGVNANAAQSYQWSWEISTDPQSNTNVQTTSYRGNASTYAGAAFTSTFTTNYTGSWNLALRIDNGTPAGGTFSYTYIVLKIAG